MCLMIFTRTSLVRVALAIAAGAPFLVAAEVTPPTADTAVLDKDGTARITRVVPVPKTVSSEAQALLATGASWCPGPRSPEAKKLIEKARDLYPVTIEEGKTIAGVKVMYVRPAKGIPASKQDRVLINLHGGGFRVDSGSYVESIPIANLTQTLVVSVYYRMAPDNKFPAAVDDVIAVYKELLKTHKASNMVIYGTSAGAALTAQAAVRIRHDRLPQPAALGFFSGNADFSNPADSHAFFGTAGLRGAEIPKPGNTNVDYLGDRDPKDPLASPLYANLNGFPPTLCMTGTRDAALASTSTFNRALRRNHVDTDLVVFDSLPHAFWYTTGVPETTEALQIQADFFDRHLGK